MEWLGATIEINGFLMVLGSGNGHLGLYTPTKTDEFLKSAERPLTPPPSFSENYVADFATKMRDFATKVRMFIMAGLLYTI